MSTPHDALFCQVFSDPRHAEGEFRAVLPDAIGELVDWSTLRLVAPSDKDVLRGDRHADLLFAAEIGGQEVLLQLLLEHKSHVDRFTAVQIGDYVFRVFRRHLREHPRTRGLPPVLSVVVYHGPGRWGCGSDLSSCFQLDGAARRRLGPFLPELRFFVDDLSLVHGEELASRTLSALARLVLEVLRRASAGDDLQGLLRGLAAEFRAVREASGDVGLLAAVLTYLGKVRDRSRVEMQRLVRAEIGPDVEEIMLSTYQQTLNEGHALGLAKGLAQALQKVLTCRFGQPDEKTVARIEAASIEQLDQWLERAATAERAELVFD